MECDYNKVFTLPKIKYEKSIMFVIIINGDKKVYAKVNHLDGKPEKDTIGVKSTEKPV